MRRRNIRLRPMIDRHADRQRAPYALPRSCRSAS